MTTTTDILSVVTRADHIVGPPQGQWTYDDYAAIPDDGKRYEIIDGVLYMAPSPNFAHQSSNMRFLAYLGTHIEFVGLGRVIGAPFDVDLGLGKTVQPDVMVILNANLGIITPEKIISAPDLVVEIASPSTAGYDRRDKQDAYARAGVPEYWVADPAARTIEVLVLEQGTYRSKGVFRGQATLPVGVLPEIPVRVEQFFA